MKLEALKNIISRIRWKRVLGVFLLLVIVLLFIRFLPLRYKVAENIGLAAEITPDSIGVGERSKVRVEIKNMYPNSDSTVILTAQTYDKNLLFMETASQQYNSSEIKIGPSETREVGFSVEAKKDTLAGNYRIDVKVAEAGKPAGAQETLFLKVEKN